LRSLLFFLAGFFLSLEAAALEKCIGPDGKISYMDTCPPGTRAPSQTDDPLVPKPRPGTVIIKPEIQPLPQPAPGSAVTVVPIPPPPPAPLPGIAPFVPAAPADVQLASYDVQGSDHASLVTALNTRGPEAGQSSWKLTYQYQPHRDKRTCAVASVTTKLELVMALPRWSPPPGTPEELIGRWEKYVNALMAHQNARLERARELERALKPALLAVPPAADCAALDAALSERYEALEQQSRARDADPGTLAFE
jgi:predicted secreted Zn-dependent protease